MHAFMLYFCNNSHTFTLSRWLAHFKAARNVRIDVFVDEYRLPFRPLFPVVPSPEQIAIGSKRLCSAKLIHFHFGENYSIHSTDPERNSRTDSNSLRAPLSAWKNNRNKHKRGYGARLLKGKATRLPIYEGVSWQVNWQNYSLRLFESRQPRVCTRALEVIEIQTICSRFIQLFTDSPIHHVVFTRLPSEAKNT